MTKRIGLVGYGYWGKNLARCLNELGALGSFLEKDYDRAKEATLAYPDLEVWVEDKDSFFARIDAVAIATPPETHYDIAREALNAGKDVFIEKPMATSSVDARSLVNQAKAQGRNLMVGHIYLHNDGIKRMPIPIGRAELYVQLLNPEGGPSESTRDLWWAGLPHAVSLACHFFPDEPVEVYRAERGSEEGHRVRVRLGYWNGSKAYLDVGDFTGRKLRRVELRMGNSRYLFDTASHEGVGLLSGTMVTSFGYGQDLKKVEPLKVECEAFLKYEGVDLMGPKVVKLIEEIRSGSYPESP